MKRFYILIAAGGMLFLNPNSFSQQPDASPSANTPAKAASGGGGTSTAKPEWVRMNIDFDGGPPDKLLAVIKKASGQMPNVIVHPEAAKVNIPPFKLRDVSAAQVFIALNTLSEPPFTSGFWKA